MALKDACLGRRVREIPGFPGQWGEGDPHVVSKPLANWSRWTDWKAFCDGPLLSTGPARYRQLVMTLPVCFLPRPSLKSALGDFSWQEVLGMELSAHWASSELQNYKSLSKELPWAEDLDLCAVRSQVVLTVTRHLGVLSLSQDQLG